MAKNKVSTLTETTSAIDGDLVLMSRPDGEGGYVSRKILWSNFTSRLEEAQLKVVMAREPAVTDDDEHGYPQWTLWAYGNEVWRSIDATNGAAVWVKTTLTLDELGSSATADVETSTPPAMNGSASVGSASTVSKSDHVHPSDTSRAAVSHTHVGTEVSIDPSGFAGNLGSGVTSAQLLAAALDGLAVGNPTGSMAYFAGQTPPTGYIVADGSAVSRSTYSSLFALIGTTFGAGDGTTTFNLPFVPSFYPYPAWVTGASFADGASYGGNLVRLSNGKLFLKEGGSQSCWLGTIGADGVSVTWAATTDYPLSLFYSEVLSLSDGRILVLGGTTTGSAADGVNNTYFGTINGDGSITWDAGTALTSIRSSMRAVQFSDGCILIVGGSTTTYLNTTLFGTITGTTISWAAGTNVPIYFAAGDMVRQADDSFLISGTASTIGTYGNRVYKGVVTGNTIAWTACTDMPRKLKFHKMLILAGQIYVIGGYDDGGVTRAECSLGTISGATISWQATQNLPQAIDRAAACALPNGKLMLFGGHTGLAVSDATYIQPMGVVGIIKT